MGVISEKTYLLFNLEGVDVKRKRAILIGQRAPAFLTAGRYTCTLTLNYINAACLIFLVLATRSRE